MNATQPWFITYVLNVLLNRRLGLNLGVRQRVLAAAGTAMDGLTRLEGQSSPVSFTATAPYLGHYEGGFSMVREGREIVVRKGPRAMPPRVMPDGSYVFSDGLVVGTAGKLAPTRTAFRLSKSSTSRRFDARPDDRMTG